MEQYRSGDFSLDPTFAADDLFESLDRVASRTVMTAAFTDYLGSHDLAAVTHVIAIYVRASRQRGHSVEHVVRDLDEIQSRIEGNHRLSPSEPSELRRAALRGVLLAFYGPDAIAREDRRRAERRTTPNH